MKTTSPDRQFGWPQLLLLLGLSLLLSAGIYSGYRLHQLSAEQAEIKEDYSLSNNITFGLFSVDQWRDRIAGVINPQVSGYEMTPAQKKALLHSVEAQLHGLVARTVAQINKSQQSLGGKLKKIAFNTMVDAKEIQAQVPAFARTIVDKVTSPKSQRRLKGIAASKLEQLERQTYDSTGAANFAVTQALYRKYRVSDPASYNLAVNSRLSALRGTTFRCAYLLLACVAMALALGWLLRKQVHLQPVFLGMALLFALVLLLTGITSSMIAVDARIRTLDFMLMGRKVSFENQVLFFQSKSLWQVIETLLRQPKPDAVLVGSLLFIFVIILPLLRIVARGMHLLSPGRLGRNTAVDYLAFECGKWDMADVMVVGILMTYIGLSGILKSQLSALNIHNSLLTTVTENNTSLQPGYFVFAAYVIFTMVLSHLLKPVRQAAADNTVADEANLSEDPR